MGSADFRMIRPIVVTDAKLTSSTVPEAMVTEYAAGTTYTLNDIRGVTTGTAQDVFKSLQAGNTGHTPASSPTWWKLIGTVYAPYAGGFTYALGAVVSNIAADVHELYESQIAGNVGNALTDKTKWLPLGSTNRYKMFDKVVNSQTIVPEQIVAQVTPGELVNTLSLLNVEGSSATVAQSVSGYSRTKSLVKHDVLNWYDFYVEVPVRVGDVVFDDIPPYITSTLTITVNNPGGDAAIGGCYIGKSRTIGQTQWEFDGGILSYSGSTTDKYGNTTLLKRSSAKRINFPVRIPDGFESEAFRLLSLYMDTEMVFIGWSECAMTIIYGFLGQWSVPVSKRGKDAQIEVKGLT